MNIFSLVYGEMPFFLPYLSLSLPDFFASFQLSSDGKKLLYIAEKKQPEAVSFFKKTPRELGKLRVQCMCLV